MHSPTTSLPQAIISGDQNAVTRLLSTGSDVNSRSASGQTPLILAIITGHTQFVRLLLDAGADPQLRDNVGLNAFDWAERKGLFEGKALLQGNSGLPQPQNIQKQSRPNEKTSATIRATSSTNEGRMSSDARASDEKARKWIAGLRARFEERAHQQETQHHPAEADQKPEPIPVAVSTDQDTLSSTEPAVAQTENSNEPVTQTEKKSSRKRCPKCNAVYDSELLGYCAHHIVALVDADTPVIVESTSEVTPWFWIILVVSISAAVVAGYYLIVSRSTSVSTMSAVAASPALAVRSQRAPAVPSNELAGKATSLPDAECPLKANGERTTGTVTVKVKINKDGRVYWTRSLGGDWLLRAAAMEAATKASFAPEKLKGVSTEGSLTYTFEP